MGVRTAATKGGQTTRKRSRGRCRTSPETTSDLRLPTVGLTGSAPATPAGRANRQATCARVIRTPIDLAVTGLNRRHDLRRHRCQSRRHQRDRAPTTAHRRERLARPATLFAFGDGLIERRYEVVDIGLERLPAPAADAGWRDPADPLATAGDARPPAGPGTPCTRLHRLRGAWTRSGIRSPRTRASARVPG